MELQIRDPKISKDGTAYVFNDRRYEKPFLIFKYLLSSVSHKIKNLTDLDGAFIDIDEGNLNEQDNPIIINKIFGIEFEDQDYIEIEEDKKTWRDIAKKQMHEKKVNLENYINENFNSHRNTKYVKAKEFNNVSKPSSENYINEQESQIIINEEENSSENNYQKPIFYNLDLKKPLEKSAFNFSEYWNNLRNNNIKSSDFAKDKNFQNLINRTLDFNKRAIFYSKIPKTRGIDYRDISLFDNGESLDFLNNEKTYLRLKTPKQLSNKIIDNQELENKYQNFYYKKDFELYKNQEITWNEFASKINKNLIARFEGIKKIARKAQDIQKETGNWSLYAAWPFIEGYNGDHIRTPFMYIPILIEFSNGSYLVKKIDEKIKINVALIQSLYTKNRQVPEELNIYFDSFEDIFKEYVKHGINFDNVDLVLELSPLKELRKAELTQPNKARFYKICNNFAIENILKSEDIYNDSFRIIRDFKTFDIPPDNQELFKNDLDTTEFKKLPINIDKNKSDIVSIALQDSSVIWGPPGTGKSEAITSLLVLAITNQNNCLVVAEKDTALAVIIKRLQEKFGLDSFALKLNDASFLKKENFWAKIKQVIQSLKNIENLEEPEMEDNLTSFLNAQDQFIKKMKELNLYNEFFWEKINNIQKFYNFFNQDEEEITNLILAFQKDFEDFEKNKTEIENLKTNKQNKENEVAYLDSVQEKINCKIIELAKPPIVFLPLEEIDFEIIARSKEEPKKIFKYLSNNHYRFIDFGKKFRENHYQINILINNICKSLKFKYYDYHEKFQKEINVINIQIKDTEERMKSFKVKYPNFDLDKQLVQELVSLKEEALAEIKKISDLYLEYQNNHFGETDQKIKDEKLKLGEFYNQAKKYFREKIIKNIVEKIENNYTITQQYINIKKMSEFTIRKQWKPSYVIKQYFELINTIFPILVSTPEEVSRYLPNDPNIFEYGIFDEASQMFIERSLPSIHRSKKTIIAGDEKQLAPSQWFRSKLDMDIDEEVIDIDYQAESLLEWGKAKFKKRLLKNHYRSSSAKLIQYSNKAFYEGRLEIADAPFANASPIELIDCLGEWEDKQNYQEARLIIEKIISIKDNFSSIGVITMNVTQRDLILSLVEEEQDLINMVYSDKSKVKLFVKNIENIQGDEAEIIIFSLGYASKFEELKVGPLNHITKNRLNVAITRAKHKMIVYKSFKANHLGAGGSSGRAILYNWVNWLEQNATNDNSEHPIYRHQNKFRSPLEEEFFELAKQKLNNKYLIKSNYVSSNYEIDIVIFNKETNRFEAAIELDGRTYHSNYDQKNLDLEKTKFLEDIGWNIIRVDSLEFWKNKNYCVTKTLTSLSIL